jgi:hypothetical protein
MKDTLTGGLTMAEAKLEREQAKHKESERKRHTLIAEAEEKYWRAKQVRLEQERAEIAELEKIRLEQERAKKSELEKIRLGQKQDQSAELKKTRLELAQTKHEVLKEIRLELAQTKHEVLKEIRFELALVKQVKQEELGKTSFEQDRLRMLELEKIKHSSLTKR